MILEKYSIGTGDRFGKQAAAQLNAVIKAKTSGADIAIVWNKSHREHSIIHTNPSSVRKAADKAVGELDWKGGYHVDADHISLGNVDLFLDSSDFFTLDVADFIGEKASDEKIGRFTAKYRSWAGTLKIPGIEEDLEIDEEKIRIIAERYLLAVNEAGKIYRHIEEKKGKDTFITEVSMDETDLPQTPEELLFILAAISDEGIPVQTIAPKFTGRFNKGVDYVGNPEQFGKEFDEDVCVIAFAVKEFGLPSNLKLSVHSGSDKFSIYPLIRGSIREHHTGIHIKTAGTTWLEELIGLAEGGGKGLEIAKEVYASALKRFDELTSPYATVIDINREKLPAASEVESWTGARFVSALRHDQNNPEYNMHLRQLLHVGYKVASEMGDRYLEALVEYEETVGKNVTGNLFDRHIKPLFMD
jgi:hypothetical protein